MVKPVKAHGLLVRGSLPLDALTFEKVVTSHEYVLVKFDTAYPFGDLHDEWKDIAKFSARNTELIAAEININQARLKDFPQSLVHGHGPCHGRSGRSYVSKVEGPSNFHYPSLVRSISEGAARA